MTVDFWTWFVAFLVVSCVVTLSVIVVPALIEFVKWIFAVHRSGNHYRRSALWYLRHLLRSRAGYVLTFLPWHLRNVYFRWRDRSLAAAVHTASIDAARMADEGLITATTGAIKECL